MDLVMILNVQPVSVHLAGCLSFIVTAVVSTPLNDRSNDKAQTLHTGCTSALQHEISARQLVSRRRLNRRDVHGFDTNRLSALVAVEMRMVVFVRMLGAVARTQGVFYFIAAVYGFVNNTFFFESPERPIEGDAVKLAEMRLNVVVRQGFMSLEENVQHLHPNDRFFQAVLR